MSIGSIVTRGFGSFGNVHLLPTLGYGVKVPPPVTPGGGDSSLPMRGSGQVNQDRYDIPQRIDNRPEPPVKRRYTVASYAKIGRCEFAVKFRRAAEFEKPPVTAFPLKPKKRIIETTHRVTTAKMIVKTAFFSKHELEVEEERLINAILNGTPIEAVFMR